ncbi:hypothetical protein Scep_017472 [Stephania cephalantha]|uniref:Uncharacterized protein n=1 Tax=Stephania cephalantha TaxID=152367 RepID=A0AAP0NV07_9MAGN
MRDGVAGSSSTASAPISPTGSTAPSNSSKHPHLRLPSARAPPPPLLLRLLVLPPPHHRPNHAFDLALTPISSPTLSPVPLVYTVAIPTTSSSSSPTPTASSPLASSVSATRTPTPSSPRKGMRKLRNGNPTWQ